MCWSFHCWHLTLWPLLPLARWPQNAHWCGGAARKKPAGIRSECKEVLGPEADFCEQEINMLFIPQHNLSYSITADDMDIDTLFLHTFYQWELRNMDYHGPRASWAAYTPLLWKQRGADPGAGSWPSLPCLTFQHCLECPPPTCQSVCSPYTLQSTTFWKVLNILISLCSKFWLPNFIISYHGSHSFKKGYGLPTHLQSLSHMLGYIDNFISIFQSLKFPPAQHCALTLSHPWLNIWVSQQHEGI